MTDTMTTDRYPVTIRGQRRDGTLVVQTLTRGSITAATEARWRRGWRWLLASDRNGDTVAEIGYDTETDGARIWWAEA